MKKQSNETIKKRLFNLYQKQNSPFWTNSEKSINRRSNFNETELCFPLWFFKGLSVGDFGCGAGDFFIIAAKMERVKGIEPST